MEQKTAIYKGLEFNDAYYEDSSLTSPDYFQITEFPIRLTAGKNLFKLKGHPTNLKVGGYLNLEVLDYNLNPVYYEIIDYIEEDKSRVVAIYIYPDSSPGDCTITLMAEAAVVNNQPVPAEWQGRPNIKWSRTLAINPTVSNDSEIIFETLPVIRVREQVAAHLDRTYAGGQQFPTYSTGTVKYFAKNGQPAIELTGGVFTSDMRTGTITVTTPINPTPTATYVPGSIQYTSAVKKILTPTTALLDSEYVVYSSQSISTHTYNQFDDSAFSLDYEATPTYTETQNSESYALVEIEGLQPATGDVSRIKMYMNNNGTVGTWESIIDVELTETEIFVNNTGSMFPDKSIGTIDSQTVINTYWTAHTYIGAVEPAAPTLTYSSADMDNSMIITSTTDISQNDAVHVVQINDAYPGLFLEKSAYKVTFDAIGTRSIYSANQNPKISVYLSGSAFDYDVTDLYNQALPKTLGKRIGIIELDSTSKRYDDQVFNFEADATGQGTLLFVIESGEWQISDIRTTTDNDSGYTPNYTRLKALVPTAHKIDNQLTFKIEYYNVAGVKSKQLNYINNLDWEGGNRYVDGNFSMLTGSLYVADSLNSGVAISGYPNSGFIRSLGYEGFNAGYSGFLLWSGSAMPSSAGTKGGVPYSGVGLELYASNNNYLRYSTTDSELDIRTDNIFIGNNTTFISASNGNIQISSNNFDLSETGNVTATDALFGGRCEADLFLYRTRATGYPLPVPFITYIDSLASKYLYGGDPYSSLMLTASYNPNWNSNSPGTIIEIESLPAPLTSIYLYSPTASYNEYSRYGSILYLRATNDFYITPTIDPGPGAGLGGGGDIIINSASIFYDLHTHTVGTRDLYALVSTPLIDYTYSSTLLIPAGTIITLVKGFEDWEIISANSFISNRAKYYSGLIIGDLSSIDPSYNTIQFENMPTQADLASLTIGQLYCDTSDGNTVKVK